MRRLNREFRLTLSAMFIGAFVLAVSANADLLSEFNFEEGSGSTTYNSVASVPAGTLYGPTYVSGMIGDYALSFDGYDYVDPTSNGYPNSTAGLATGTFSFWINTTVTGKVRHVFTTKAAGGGASAFVPALMNASDPHSYVKGGMYFDLCTANNHSLQSRLTNTSWLDGEWHLITTTWDTKINGATTNTIQHYIDGVAEATSMGTNNIMASDTFGSWDASRIGGSLWPGSSANIDGSLDDVSVWDDMLSATEALALYNLADDDVLNYGASDSQTLFDIFASQGSGTTGDGNAWQYVTGLSGAAGTVLDHNTVVLGAGVGVQIIPEPGTLALLATGLIGLLCYAWRKRK